MESNGREGLIRLLVIADDLTGALDTGARLAAGGADVLVLTEWRNAPDRLPEVLVADTETRHLLPGEARRIVRAVCTRYPAERVYKKTDSALRGNVGAELAGVMDAYPGMELSFVPAFPAVGRTVRDGRLLVDGVPVHRTAFGWDPFEPVRTDCVADVIRSQADEEIAPASPGDVLHGNARRIRVWDSETEEDLAMIARTLTDTGERLLAGCAGFAGALPCKLGFNADVAPGIPYAERLLVLCGSLHPVTKKQLAYAASRGAVRFRLSAGELAGKEIWDLPKGRERLRSIEDRLRSERVLLIDTEEADTDADPGDGRKRAAESLGALFRALVRTGGPFLPLLTGGDTLAACMDALGVRAIRLLGEAADGVAVATYEDGAGEQTMLTKSGGFGSETLIADLAARFLLPEHTV